MPRRLRKRITIITILLEHTVRNIEYCTPTLASGLLIVVLILLLAAAGVFAIFILLKKRVSIRSI
nr:hypothetical protein [Treponema denticola]